MKPTFSRAPPFLCVWLSSCLSDSPKKKLEFAGLFSLLQLYFRSSGNSILSFILPSSGPVGLGSFDHENDDDDAFQSKICMWRENLLDSDLNYGYEVGHGWWFRHFLSVGLFLSGGLWNLWGSHVACCLCVCEGEFGKEDDTNIGDARRCKKLVGKILDQKKTLKKRWGKNLTKISSNKIG